MLKSVSLFTSAGIAETYLRDVGVNIVVANELLTERAKTITMRNDAISSQLNVHPGRLLKNGTYSDARVLTPLELMILSSLPTDWNIPAQTPENLIRKCIGECIPPLMIKKVVAPITNSFVSKLN